MPGHSPRREALFGRAFRGFPITTILPKHSVSEVDGMRQILMSHRVAIAVEDTVKLEEVCEVVGLSQAVAVFNVVQ